MIPARHYTRGRIRTVRLIVIHTMESAEKPGTARAVAQWFAGDDAPQASAHWCIDADEAIPCVDEADTAWAAPGANADGVQLEHSGRAGQRAAGWADAYSRAVLARSAQVAARSAARWRIPIQHLTDAQLAAGAAGFVGHDQVTRVYRRSDHTDPGPDFPWAAYLQMVRDGGAPAGEDDDQMTEEQLEALANRVADKVTSIRARNPVIVDEGTGAAKLSDGRDIDALSTVVGELQHEQRCQGAVLDEVLAAVKRLSGSVQ